MCATKVGEDQMGENQTEKTEEECVEAVWEKWLGQRFLMMGAGNQILSWGLFWGCSGAGVCVLGVLLGGAVSGFGGAGVWGKKHTVNLYLTMGNYGNKIGFGVQTRFLEV